MQKMQNMWMVQTKDVFRVGLTKEACLIFETITAIEFPSTTLRQGDVAVVIETGKALYDIESDYDGTIICINGDIKEVPSLLLEDPEGRGWLFEMELFQEPFAKGSLEI